MTMVLWLFLPLSLSIGRHLLLSNSAFLRNVNPEVRAGKLVRIHEFHRAFMRLHAFLYYR